MKRQGKSSEVTREPSAGIEDLLTEHLPQLWRVAMRLTNYHAADAEDVLQDMAVRAFKARGQLAEVVNGYSWLRKILVNTFLNTFRDSAKWRELRALSDAESVAGDGDLGPTSGLLGATRSDLWDDDLKRALDQLSELSRQLFLLSDVEGYTHEELAAMFELPRGTVSSQIYRARKRLASTLEDYAVARGFVRRETLQQERESYRVAAAECPNRAHMEQQELNRINSRLERREPQHQ